jgi:hypothetical protein
MTFLAGRLGDPAAGKRVTGSVGPGGRWDFDADEDRRGGTLNGPRGRSSCSWLCGRRSTAAG